MTREILFRGKRLDNGEWVEGNLITGIHWLDKNEIAAIVPLDNTFFPRCEITGWFEVDPSTVGQFTGLTANGKKIFEGDILKCSDGTTCIVEWDNENARFLGFSIGKCRSIAYVGREPKSEVIGNIHDNPELLEGKG